MNIETKRLFAGAVLGTGLLVGGGALLHEGTHEQGELSKVAGCLEPSEAQKPVCQNVAVEPGALLQKNSVEKAMDNDTIEQMVGGGIALLGAVCMAGALYYYVRPGDATQ